MQTVSWVVHSSGQMKQVRTDKVSLMYRGAWHCRSPSKSVGPERESRGADMQLDPIHMAGRMIGLVSGLGGRNPKGEPTVSRLSNWKLKTPEKDRGGADEGWVTEMSLDGGGGR